jgi:predicted dehydrogenase
LRGAKALKDINFAIVGFGGIGRTHAIGAYAANLQFSLPYLLNLKTVVSRKPVNSKLPPNVHNSLDIEEVLKDEDIHFIDICTPNDSHSSIVSKALQYGKTIYCEKPLSSSYRDALEMTKAVDHSGVKNAVALMYRYMPALRLLKEEIEAGAIGDIIDFKIKLYHKSYLDPAKKGSWRMGESSGGGALLDLGVHLIDAVHFTLGDISTVSCINRIYFNNRTEVDEISHCKFTLPQNIEGSLEVSRIFADNEEPTTYTIYGTKGSIKLKSSKPYSIEIYNYENNMTVIKSKSSKTNLLEYYPGERSSPGFHHDCHLSSLIHVANMVFNDKEDSIVPTFKDALKAQRVVEAAYISDKENRTVIVEELDQN